MLANISSKIIVAVIAIIVLYTLAPLFKTLLDDLFFKKPKKKSFSESEFDEMVSRKKEQLSGRDSMKDQALTSNKNVRDELDSLYDIGFFKSESDFKDAKDLKKELQWGTGDHYTLLKEILKRLNCEVDDSAITTTSKKVLKKKNMINSFCKGQCDTNSIYELIALNVLLDQYRNSDNDKIFKNYRLNKKELCTLILLSIEPESLDMTINDYVSGSSNEELNLPIFNKKMNSLNQLFTSMDKNLSLFEPLIKRDKKYFSQKFYHVKDDEIKTKSLYKKLVQLHHPDKWSYVEKTSLIAKRLNENFNNLRDAYEDALKS